MNCPGCGTRDMAVETYEGNYGSKVEIDVCHSCNGIWFDGRESLQLSPGSTLKLFKSMHDRQAQARAPMADALRCTRCNGRLVVTNDRVKGTSYTYFRCEAGQCGRFITFFNFLREKALVRTPSASELDELKARVKFVNCSNCGAPVTLMKESACAHCAAPVSILAQERIEETLKALHAKEIDRNTIKPEKIIDAMMIKEQVNSRHRLERITEAAAGRASWGGDLVGLGVGLLIEAIFS